MRKAKRNRKREIPKVPLFDMPAKENIERWKHEHEEFQNIQDRKRQSKKSSKRTYLHGSGKLMGNAALRKVGAL